MGLSLRSQASPSPLFFSLLLIFLLLFSEALQHAQHVQWRVQRFSYKIDVARRAGPGGGGVQGSPLASPYLREGIVVNEGYHCLITGTNGH